MRPSKIIPGTQLLITPSGGGQRNIAFFVRRIPAQGGRPAKNYLRFPRFAGLDGPNDDGTCEMSDYELSRRGVFAPNSQGVHL